MKKKRKASDSDGDAVDLDDDAHRKIRSLDTLSSLSSYTVASSTSASSKLTASLSMADSQMSRVALQVQALKMHCRGPAQVEAAPCKISLAPAAPARAVATPARACLLLDAEELAGTCRGKESDPAPTILEGNGKNVGKLLPTAVLRLNYEIARSDLCCTTIVA